MRVGLLGADRSAMFLIRRTLIRAGHIAEHYRSTPEFLAAIHDKSFEALVLGSLDPTSDELQLLRRVRQEFNLSVPIIMVTGESTEEYVVNALREGADDCLVPSIGQREFLARLEAISRRWLYVPKLLKSFQIGAITVNGPSRRILVDGEPIELSTRNFDLALFLLQNIGRLVTRTQIMHAVWGWSAREVRSRTLDTHISRVRRRLRLLEPQGWRLAAVYRKGYRLERLV